LKLERNFNVDNLGMNTYIVSDTKMKSEMTENKLISDSYIV